MEQGDTRRASWVPAVEGSKCEEAGGAGPQ